MDQAYWLERERDSIAHARASTLPDVRLIHYDLAHGYSIKAASAGREHLGSGGPQLKRNLDEQLMTAFDPNRTLGPGSGESTTHAAASP
jgi:hypothetical protein